MDTARADILAARDHLRQQGWIAPRNESFRHLPPPGLENWLQGPTDDTARLHWVVPTQATMSGRRSWPSVT